jgi:lysophospholipase L1-like esterase
LPTLRRVRTSRLGLARLRGTVLVAVLLTAGCGTVPPAAGPAAPATSTSRTTSTTARAALHVVGLGDSVTSGEHCDCDDYVTTFGSLLHERDGVEVRVVNDGRSGSTADDLAGELAQEKDLREDATRGDVVVVTTGANDLGPALGRWRAGGCGPGCYGPDVDQMETDLGRVLDGIDALGHHPRVLVTSYWNVFTDGQVARDDERSGYLGWSDAVTREANAAISRAAVAHGATVVDLYAPFKGDGRVDPSPLLADDGDHPDAAGTAVIADAVLAAYPSTR